MPTTALLDSRTSGSERARPPEGPVVFVHGDVWPGNTMIVGARVRSLIDWKPSRASAILVLISASCASKWRSSTLLALLRRTRCRAGSGGQRRARR